MSRSGYSEDADNLVLYRQAVDRAVGGKRGKAFLQEMADALDAMPVKELVTDVIVADGQACAIGAVAIARNLDVSDLDVHDADEVAKRFGVARSLAAEIAYMNDEWNDDATPAERWAYMREWVAKCLLTGRAQ